MLQPNILNYYSAQKDSFFKNYRAALEIPDFDAIHDLRVSIKRLDTLFRMLNLNSNANFRLKQSFRPIKLVFKKTGKIRDFQIFIKLLVTLDKELEMDFSNIIDICNHKIEKLVKDFVCSAQLSDYQSYRRNLNIFEKYINSQSETDLISKMENLRLLSEKRFKIYSDTDNKNQNLHSARKAIKDLSYLIEMLSSENEIVENQKLKYKQIGSLLGDWHDHATLYNFLVSSINKSLLTGNNFEILITEVKTVKYRLKMDFQSLT